MAENIRNTNGVNHIALYKSVDPSVSFYTGLKKKKGFLQRDSEKW